MARILAKLRARAGAPAVPACADERPGPLRRDLSVAIVTLMSRTIRGPLMSFLPRLGVPALAVVGGLLAADAALAQERVLTVGLTAEPSALVTAARLALGVFAIVLLLVGRTLPRSTVGTLVLGLGLAIGWGALAEVSYLLVAMLALAVFAAGMAAYLWAPRVAMALACAWIGPAALLAGQYSRGDFSPRTAPVILLALAGCALGAAAPRLALAVLSPALGTLTLAVAWPGQREFWPLLALFAATSAWQIVMPALRRPAPDQPAATAADRHRERLRRLGGSLRVAAAVLVLALVTAALAAPTRDGGVRDRLAALWRLEGRPRPGFVLSANDSFYLLGSALPVALVGPWGGARDRLGAIVLGRSPGGALAELRAVKDASEIGSMRRAAAITSDAFAAVAPLIRPGATEKELEQAILATFRREGADGLAFGCIVGSGANAALPHYQENGATLREGLVVIDIGCSVDHYASDMTRTFPVRGSWTPEQRRLLDAVLAAKDKVRRALRPGVRLRDLDRIAHESIVKAGFGPYFTHSIGHLVGLEVHDPHVDLMRPGMVVTIEPGLYVKAGADLDKAFWNLGVRVEDSYLVTNDGCEALTHFPEASAVPATPVPASTAAGVPAAGVGAAP